MTSVQLAGASDADLAEVALTRSEYVHLVASLGREPNRLELGIVGALWSEHCSYKTSRPLLGTLPTTGPRVLQGPGENAGAVDIGRGLACVFKIESHNHPSAIEPYQGAATGVGGILRDIFTMGARPIALLDSLRFGPLDEPHQRHLFDGVVAGIGGYGNCIGVPTVGGELYFDESYRTNCLVNAMCVGIVEQGKLTRATASGPGNLVLLVGADTGRDGIHGASFASVVLDAESAARRPAVQVGNPFLEKCLMEACLELAGDPRVIAMQDLGAAGLCGSTAELAHRGGCGIEIDVARASRRETGMTPYEVMLSESQERMLIVARPADVGSLQQVFERWDLHSDVVAVILPEQRFVVRDGADHVCDLPLDLLVDGAPLRGAPGPRPHRPAPMDADGGPAPSWTPDEALLHLLGSPNIGSRASVYRRYDHQVGDATVILPGGDAALVRVDGTPIGLALATDGNSRYAALDARQGAMIAVCEAARNVVATGAKPAAVTNCLNFANPEHADVWWDLHDAIAGLGDACRALDIPVVSGNVSLYNDTGGTGIDPTIVIGMVGVIDDVSRRCTAGFRDEGDLVALVGPVATELGGSEYQRMAHGVNAGTPPHLDIDLERRVQAFVLEAVAADLLGSAHDCAEGGIAIAIAESCLLGDIGASVDIVELGRGEGLINGAAGILFGESQSRFVISFAREALVRLHELAGRHSVPFRGLGSVGGERVCVTGCIDVSLADVRRVHEGALIERE
ncbi:MAG TPA: phosphoribosylformylglycinamidine synthase subunit PurL [Candidatus Saccharimonadales bacterium]|nr:phosphoribosylformylglycinamidine synthase subunit PurL [Candidatus Saccharimonadales bacterium]